MNRMEQILSEVRSFVRSELATESSGHDWWHAFRVAALAKQIALREHADVDVCELAALLHDIADEKVTGSESAGLAQVSDVLSRLGLDETRTEHVLEIITSISFKGGQQPPVRTVEAMVVQDADRLDAIGAIGIARVFAFSGAHGRLIHDPDTKPRDQLTAVAYRQDRSTGINHFYEKLLKLKERMNTDYGKVLASQRHQVMLDYLEQFYAEWQGER